MNGFRLYILSAAAAVGVVALAACGAIAPYIEDAPTHMALEFRGPAPPATLPPQRVDCPRFRSGDAVIFAVGQSNAGNSAEVRKQSEFGDRVLNLFDGQCFIAQDPLQGGEGDKGSIWVPMANGLIRSGAFNRIFLSVIAFGGAPIIKFRQGERYNQIMVETLKFMVRTKYAPTHYIWLQGEADGQGRTPGVQYRSDLAAIISQMKEIHPAPVYIGVTSSCPPIKSPPNREIRDAQSSLANPGNDIFQGPDLDAIVGADRFDLCHLSAKGQLKAASLWQRAISGASTAAHF